METVFLLKQNQCRPISTGDGTDPRQVPRTIPRVECVCLSIESCGPNGSEPGLCVGCKARRAAAKGGALRGFFFLPFFPPLSLSLSLGLCSPPKSSLFRESAHGKPAGGLGFGGIRVRPTFVLFHASPTSIGTIAH